jgi:RNA polymerase sigma factor (sigma-70 family)
MNMDEQEVYDLIEGHYLKKYRAMVRFIARMGVREKRDQEDVINTAMVSALQYCERYDPSLGKIGTWIETILRNAARDHLAANRRQGMSVCPDSIDAEELLDVAYDIETQAIAEEELGIITEEIYKLEPIRADIVRGFLLLGHTAKEIAVSSGWSEVAVWKAVSRFRTDLGPRCALGS